MAGAPSKVSPTTTNSRMSNCGPLRLGDGSAGAVCASANTGALSSSTNQSRRSRRDAYRSILGAASARLIRTVEDQLDAAGAQEFAVPFEYRVSLVRNKPGVVFTGTLPKPVMTEFQKLTDVVAVGRTMRLRNQKS